MVSLKLWRALNHPPRQHPLFEFVLTHANRKQYKITSGFFMWIFMCSVLTFFWTIIFDWLPYLILTLLILWNTVYAVRWTLRISDTISTEKEQRRFDLLASLPFGMLGTSWAISTGCLHRRGSFRWMPYMVQVFTIVVVCTMLFTIGVTLLAMNTGGEELRGANTNLLYVSLAIIPFLIAFYLDHIYSILTSILVGIVATLDTRYSTEAKVRALLGFLMMQLVIYALIFAVAIWGLPQILGWIGINGSSSILINAAISIAIFLTLREALVQRMWNYLTKSLNAEENEVELVLRSNPSRA